MPSKLNRAYFALGVGVTCALHGLVLEGPNLLFWGGLTVSFFAAGFISDRGTPTQLPVQRLPERTP